MKRETEQEYRKETGMSAMVIIENQKHIVAYSGGYVEWLVEQVEKLEKKIELVQCPSCDETIAV